MRKFLLMLTLLMSVMVASAQKAIEVPKILDNVYVGANVGAVTPITFEEVFPLNAQVSARVGKDWSPIFGTYLEGTGFIGDRGMYSSNTLVKSTTASLGSTINLTNLIAGYNGTPRNFDVLTVASVGWYHVLNAGTKNVVHCDDFVSKTGVDLAWNTGSKKQWQLYIEPAVYWNLSANKGGTIQFNKNYVQVGVSVGANYKFKTSNGTHNFKVYDIAEIIKDVNVLRAENDYLKNRKPQITEKIVEKVVEKTIYVTKSYVVNFAFDSAELNGRAKQELDLIPTNSIVSIEASASPEGSVDHNLKLSQDRADAVKNYLESKGIVVRSADGIGVYDGASGRQAIITIVQ